jgi:hypothetical protein
MWKGNIPTIFEEMKTKLGVHEFKEQIQESNEKLCHEIWELHHFYLQHARIPTLNLNEPTLTRLMQIAFNAGQLRACWNFPIYSEKLKAYYNDNNLQSIETYMESLFLDELNQQLPIELLNHKLLNPLND